MTLGWLISFGPKTNPKNSDFFKICVVFVGVNRHFTIETKIGRKLKNKISHSFCFDTNLPFKYLTNTFSADLLLQSEFGFFISEIFRIKIQHYLWPFSLFFHAFILWVPKSFCFSLHQPPPPLPLPPSPPIYCYAPCQNPPPAPALLTPLGPDPPCQLCIFKTEIVVQCVGTLPFE